MRDKSTSTPARLSLRWPGFGSRSRPAGHSGPKVAIWEDKPTGLFLARHHACNKQVAACATWNDAMLVAAKHIRCCRAVA